jgi:hypothetical protein
LRSSVKTFFRSEEKTEDSEGRKEARRSQQLIFGTPLRYLGKPGLAYGCVTGVLL